jgi:hypothetical protein
MVTSTFAFDCLLYHELFGAASMKFFRSDFNSGINIQWRLRSGLFLSFLFILFLFIRSSRLSVLFIFYVLSIVVVFILTLSLTFLLLLLRGFCPLFRISDLIENFIQEIVVKLLIFLAGLRSFRVFILLGGFICICGCSPGRTGRRLGISVCCGASWLLIFMICTYFLVSSTWPGCYLLISPKRSLALVSGFLSGW